MQEQQAMNWYQAEMREHEKTLDCRAPRELRDPIPSWLELTEGRREEIRKRVELVLTGEVRRSEMGPGDLSIYFGRYRTLEQSPPDHFMERLKEGSCEMHRVVWWDCLEFHDTPRASYSTRLFGNCHVGQLNLTNLQVAGQLAGDHTAFLNGWHLVLSNEPELMSDVERLFSNATATLTVGDRLKAQRHLIQLWREPQPIEVDLPSRQNFSVYVEFFGRGFRSFCDKVIEMRRDPERDPFRLWICLEGWEIRSVW
jgi:hypothetical protein